MLLIAAAQDASPAPAPGAPGFDLADWLVLGGYFLVLALSGIWFSRRKQENADDYFLARHSMPVWAVALSVVATALSGATFLGGPQQSFAGNLTYLITVPSAMIAVLIVAFYFIPQFYKHNVATVYGLLEVRFGRGAKQAASVMFVIGRIFADGSRVFIAAIPTALILFNDANDRGSMQIAIAVVMLVGIFYTFAGGIRSVIFTDAIQLFVFVGAAIVALIVISNRITAPLSEVMQTLANPPVPEGAPQAASKLIAIDPGVSSSGIEFGKAFTILTAISGYLLLNLAAYGMDHDMAQRMLTCKSAKKGSGSVIAAILLNAPITLLFLVVGLALYVFYQCPHLMGGTAPDYKPDSTRVFAEFIVRELAGGMKGLMLAGLFAAALSSVNSSLNSMSSAIVNDLYMHAAPDKPAKHYVWVGRACVVLLGIAMGAFAMLCVQAYDPNDPRQTLIKFALDVMTFAYTGLAAVFLTALFTKRGSSRSVIAALIVGFVTVLVMHPVFWAALTPDGAKADTNWLAAMTAWSKSIEFPWRMLAGTALAMGVCLMGSSTRSET
ncbi:MAG: hypothetical protein WD768_04930 [Phycisphaeraceae bacterium]